MALNPTLVGQAIATAVAGAAPPAGQEITPTELENLWVTIVTEIFGSSGGIQAAVVTIPSVTGVTPGGGVSGPGTGTIS